MTTTLPNAIGSRIERLCNEGDQFAASGRHAAAVMRFATAFRLLPRPPEKWSETPRILASMVDSCFAQADYIGAGEAALAALDCPAARDNPALRCKLGQIYFEQGDMPAARGQFLAALGRGGDAVFADEDPKYRRLLDSPEL